MGTFRDLQKICNRRYVLPDEHEITRIVIDITNSHISPANLSLSVSECGILDPPTEILDEMFNFASNALQDAASIVQCLGSEGYLAKSK